MLSLALYALHLRPRTILGQLVKGDPELTGILH